MRPVSIRMRPEKPVWQQKSISTGGWAGFHPSKSGPHVSCHTVTPSHAHRHTVTRTPSNRDTVTRTPSHCHTHTVTPSHAQVQFDNAAPSPLALVDLAQCPVPHLARCPPRRRLRAR
eukprot:18076-Chlamydomonas_euryale.AAC.1